MTAVHDFPEKSGSASNRTARVLADRAAGEAYVASVCFKHGPPRLLGVELEFTVHHTEDPARPLDPDVLATALGPHAPRTLRPDSPAAPLPAGSPVSLEPGCQVEISTLPQASLRELNAVASADLSFLTTLLARHGLELGESGIDAHRPPRRVLHTPRYAAMERRFAPLGDGGITMMCSTAGLQICVDVGEGEDVAARWAAAHLMGPPLLATFANSRVRAGRDTGTESARWLAVMDTEPVRTRAADPGPDPAAGWGRRMMDTPLMVLPRGDRPWDAPDGLTFGDWICGRGAAAVLSPPTVEDLDYHLTTMFTPVRPHGYLEIRYLDAQPPREWLPPVALVSALLARPSTVDEVRELCAPVAGRWADAARAGLQDDSIAAVAKDVVELGITELGTTGLDTETTTEIAESVRARVNGSRSHQR
ncbi:glutamate-cysteine ligase family protein [Amycolatopsis sp. FDAARGOS 1241]|uniref:glutamate-cysteine ligase family protein n=1 Tax=Amycolatopsis sp. FDAARGOS 1241 TaxID=2778070 RepID=UPI0019518E01|nr:glutamate-cysteine ligase family protein [Amycolatopsis sp. FDAARGOS 1241]QRP49647.1 ergothioneine biosynthesis glutamate--cysteine ligase EgtA [Amycolatopsis sp. FDAARGOS 1241]